ncbi:MAG: glucose-1-phosphate adenylyltransferase, partial [Candidatus Rokuibacteriota bacterium]
MRRPRVLVMIMAGGKGERLHPLTRDRSKPAVPFGGRHRIVDFVLSNFVNSEMLSLYVLVQYKSQSLIEHVRLAWRTTGIVPDYFVTIVPPQMRAGPAWYRGTADAVLQNLNLVDDFNPDVVAIFGSDHIYRMDVNQMLAFHLETGADVTVAARPVPVADASQFGVLGVDRDRRVTDFQEKPDRPSVIPGGPGRALVSMGNYLFTRRVLVAALLDDARRSTQHDFGRSIIPELVPHRRVCAYDFQLNEVAGVKPYEEPGYWRDVGTIETYWQAHMDLLGEEPRFDLDNREWPIRTGQVPGPPARIIGGDVDDVQIAEGSLIKRATIRNSILGRSVWVNEGALIEDSIIMDHTTVGKGARVRRAIIDRFNIIPADAEIGLDPAADRRHY